MSRLGVSGAGTSFFNLTGLCQKTPYRSPVIVPLFCCDTLCARRRFLTNIVDALWNLPIYDNLPILPRLVILWVLKKYQLGGIGLICEATLISLLGLAAVRDLRSYKVPNILLLFGCAAGVILRIIFNGPRSIPSMTAGFFLPFALCFPLFVFSMMGAGDCKLFMMTGLYLGGRSVLIVMASSCLLSLAGALLKIGFSGILSQRIGYFFRYLMGLRTERRIQPYIRDTQIRREERYFVHFSVYIFLAAAALCLYRCVRSL